MVPCPSRGIGEQRVANGQHRKGTEDEDFPAPLQGPEARPQDGAQHNDRQCRAGSVKGAGRQEIVAGQFEQGSIGEDEVGGMEVREIPVGKQTPIGQQPAAGDELVFVMTDRNQHGLHEDHAGQPQPQDQYQTVGGQPFAHSVGQVGENGWKRIRQPSHPCHFQTTQYHQGIHRIVPAPTGNSRPIAGPGEIRFRVAHLHRFQRPAQRAAMLALEAGTGHPEGSPKHPWPEPARPSGGYWRPPRRPVS